MNKGRLRRLVRAKMVSERMSARTIFDRLFCDRGAIRSTAASFADGLSSLGMKLSNTAAKRLMKKLIQRRGEETLKPAEFVEFVSEPDPDEVALRAVVLHAAAKGNSLNAHQTMSDMDTGDTGRLSRGQFARALKRLGMSMSDQETRKLADRYADAADDGYVLYREFVPTVEAVVRRYDGVKGLLQRVRKAVERYVPPTDADDRARRVGAVQTAMTPRSRGKKKASAQERVFKKLDTNNTGSVDYDSFAKGLRQMGVQLDETEMRELCESLDWDMDRTIGYLEFVQLMQAEAAEAFSFHDDDVRRGSESGGAEAKADGGVNVDDDSKAPEGAVQVFEGIMRGVKPHESVTISMSTLQLKLKLDQARKVKTVTVEFRFLDEVVHSATAQLDKKKKALMGKKLSFVTRRGTEGFDRFKRMLREMQTDPQRGEIEFRVYNTTGSAKKVLGVGTFNMNAILDQTKDLTHEVIKLLPDMSGASGSRQPSMRQVGTLMIGVTAWACVNDMLNEVLAA